MKYQLPTLFIFLIALCLPALSVSEGPRSKSLKVAVVLGLTGSAAYHSAGIRKGIELAAEELVKGGWQIDLHFEDDQTNPAKTVSAMQFLIAQGYRFYIGPTWSFQVNAIKEIVSNNKIIAMVPAGSSEINGGAAKGIFNLCPARSRQEPSLINWLNTTKYKRAIILTPNGDWGEIHRQVFHRSMVASGGKVVAEDQFDYGIDMSSLKSILLKHKGQGIDLVLTTGAAADVANVVRARNLLKLDFAILSTNDLRDALALRLLSPQDLGEKVFTVGLEIEAEFRSRFKNRFGEEPILYSDRGYDALKILAEAAEKTDGSPEAVRRFLKSDLEFAGVSGQIKFDSQGDISAGDYRVGKLAR